MTIEQIKSSLSILRVLSHYGLSVNRNGMVCCPFHDDKKASMKVYRETDTVYCFAGSCEVKNLDVIDFIMKMDRSTKHEAIVKAKSLVNPYAVKKPKRNSSQSRVEMTEREQSNRAAVLLKFYQSSLHSIAKSKNAKAYADGRGLNVTSLGIGFCGYGVGKTWSEELKEKASAHGLLGIRNCLIFALRGSDGQVCGMYGRSISANAKTRHFYMKGKITGLYPRYPKANTKELILTESIIDAATLEQYQELAVLALYGTGGFTDEHRKVIKGLSELEEVILFFDGDEAGEKAVEKYSELLKGLRSAIRISRVATPGGEDPSSLLQTHEPEVLEHLINERIYIGESLDKPLQSKGHLNTENGELLIYQTDDLLIEVLGGIKITGLDKMKVTLKNRSKVKPHLLPLRHSLDLYNAGQVDQLVNKIAERLEVGTSEVERLINYLTGALESYRAERLEELKPKKVKKRLMSEGEKAECLKYLKDKKLLRNTLEDIGKSGIVGEVENSLIAYLVYTSRKREKPLHIMCLGSSGSGKTYLQEMVSSFIPEAEKIEITSLSDNAFYYFGREELKGKLILIEDIDGAENVLYPLRELQSKRRISKTVTIKDTKGNLKTINLRVEGPVCVSSCTTRERIYEDNANRCILLYIDDSTDQDKRIMAYQQKVSAGKVNTTIERSIRKKLQNVQRLLRPVRVINPYAELIDLPEEVFKPRRTLLLLLSFIETITFYHQYQRSWKTDGSGQYIETSVEDVEAGFSLMKEVLFNKSDELSKVCRKFLEALKKEVKDGQVFYTQDIRKKLRYSSSTIHRYVGELKRNGYIKYKGGNKFKGYEYEIVDYEEYKKLRSQIDDKLEAILKKIKKLKSKCPTIPKLSQ